ncbi:hypothetical protein F5Y19DRAFT_101046 [Xylariaceae sp. FL1651]|nr:hypothetical protein F5Y19DRAFT_101046 [Xylariaceae sp. FL1651]
MLLEKFCPVHIVSILASPLMATLHSFFLGIPVDSYLYARTCALRAARTHGSPMDTSRTNRILNQYALLHALHDVESAYASRRIISLLGVHCPSVAVNGTAAIPRASIQLVGPLWEVCQACIASSAASTSLCSGGRRGILPLTCAIIFSCFRSVLGPNPRMNRPELYSSKVSKRENNLHQRFDPARNFFSGNIMSLLSASTLKNTLATRRPAFKP